MVQLETISELDELVAGLEHEHCPNLSLLREHLQGARSYLLGAMPEEYKLNLRLAETATDCIKNGDLQRRLLDFIRREADCNK